MQTEIKEERTLEAKPSVSVHLSKAIKYEVECTFYKHKDAPQEDFYGLRIGRISFHVNQNEWLRFLGKIEEAITYGMEDAEVPGRD